ALPAGATAALRTRYRYDLLDPFGLPPRLGVASDSDGGAVRGTASVASAMAVTAAAPQAASTTGAAAAAAASAAAAARERESGAALSAMMAEVEAAEVPPVLQRLSDLYLGRCHDASSRLREAMAEQRSLLTQLRAYQRGRAGNAGRGTGGGAGWGGGRPHHYRHHFHGHHRPNHLSDAAGSAAAAAGGGGGAFGANSVVGSGRAAAGPWRLTAARGDRCYACSHVVLELLLWLLSALPLRPRLARLLVNAGTLDRLLSCNAHLAAPEAAAVTRRALTLVARSDRGAADAVAQRLSAKLDFALRQHEVAPVRAVVGNDMLVLQGLCLDDPAGLGKDGSGSCRHGAGFGSGESGGPAAGIADGNGGQALPEKADGTGATAADAAAAVQTVPTEAAIAVADAHSAPPATQAIPAPVPLPRRDERIAVAVDCWAAHVRLLLDTLHRAAGPAGRSLAVALHVVQPCLEAVVALCLAGDAYPLLPRGGGAVGGAPCSVQEAVRAEAATASARAWLG
ncbi:unnamed protein product, partial [Phaeothamnion confervicola]